MKQKKTLLLAGLALLLALCLAGYAVLQNWNKAQEEAQSAETSAPVTDLAAADVTALRYDVAGYAMAFSQKDGAWQYDADPAFPLAESYVTAMVNAARAVSGTGPLEDAQALAEYGLAAGCDSITLTTADGDTTLLLGAENALTGQRYAAVEGRDGVYLVDDIAATFTRELLTMAQKEELPAFTALRALTVKNRYGTLAAHVEDDPESFYYTDAYAWFTGEGDGREPLVADTLTGAVNALSWASCAAYNVTDFAPYGLDAPVTVTVAYQTDDGEEAAWTLRIGNACAEGYYASPEGSDMVYVLSADTAKVFVDANEAALRPTAAVVMDWDTVSEVRLLAAEGNHTLAFRRATVSGEDDATTVETTYQLDGADVDTAAAERWLAAVNALEGADAGDKTPTGETLLTLAFTRSDGVLALTALDQGDGKAAVSLDGANWKLVEKTAVTELAEQLKALAKADASAETE